MESDTGKLFIGGISWETTEDRLRQYFKKFGEVIEVIIMKDRITGRGRGFGFLVFADSTVAERVIIEKHLIDGRMVEAKKAVPKDYQHILNRNSISSVQGSPGPARTKKIFVGGLASTVTDADFKRYFEQFGSITDVVVMYDHNTQKPRGFGFITFDVEDAVDKVLHKTFHELNGKMVEVKRAVPRELSPGPNMRSPTGAYNYALNRINGFLSGYSPTQGYNPSSIKGYGMRVDGRFGPLASGRKGLHSFDPGYGIGMDFEPGLSPIYNGNSDFNGTVDYAKNLSPYHIGNSGRFGNPIGFGGINGSGSTFSTTTHNLRGNSSLHCTMNPTGSNAYMTPGSGSLAGFGNSEHNWGATSSLAVHGLGSGSNFIFGNPNYGSGENSFGLVDGNYEKNIRIGSVNNSFVATSNVVQDNFTNFYGDSSLYKDPTWQPVSSELDGSSTFGYGLGLLESNVSTKLGSTGSIGAYNVSNRQVNKGVAA